MDKVTVKTIHGMLKPKLFQGFEFLDHLVTRWVGPMLLRRLPSSPLYPFAPSSTGSLAIDRNCKQNYCQLINLETGRTQWKYWIVDSSIRQYSDAKPDLPERLQITFHKFHSSTKCIADRKGTDLLVWICNCIVTIACIEHKSFRHL
jgi:hypothetical protein